MAKKRKKLNEFPSINFRLSEDLKERLIEKAHKENMTVSNYLREHLEEFVDGSLFEKEMVAYDKDTFINSTGFIQLIVWMYSKRSNNNCEIDQSSLNGYISTLKKINRQLGDELEKEFEKVLRDVLKVRDEESSKKFKFCKVITDENMGKTFDYELLENYLLNREYVVKLHRPY